MELRYSQDVRQTQGLSMTPRMQQAIKLLSCNRQELREIVAKELEENPLLEEISDESGEEIDENFSTDDFESDEQEKFELVEEIVDQKEENLFLNEDIQKIETQNSALEDDNFYQFDSEFDSTHLNYDYKDEDKSGLTTHLLEQLSNIKLEENLKNLIKFLIHNLTDEGFLDLTEEEIFKNFSCSKKEIDFAIDILQSFYPRGIGARSLEECICLQIEFDDEWLKIEKEIIENSLQDLMEKKFDFLAEKYKIPLRKIEYLFSKIKEIDPRPGAQCIQTKTEYVIPDVIVSEIGGHLYLSFHELGIPKVQINSYYTNWLANTSLAKNDQTRAYIEDKNKMAKWFVNSLNHRNKTIFKVAQAILDEQREYFLSKKHQLKPMILKDIANKIGIHESTVSRATQNKYMLTPLGLFEFKYFFNTGPKDRYGESNVSSETIKLRIKSLIQAEDERTPLSDQRIVEILSKEQIVLARRTVTKYRELLGIKSSAQRKK